MPIPMTENELIEALRASRVADSTEAGGLTVLEISRQTGWGEERVRRSLQDLHAAGKLTCARALRPAIDGTQRPVPTYRLSE